MTIESHDNLIVGTIKVMTIQSHDNLLYFSHEFAKQENTIYLVVAVKLPSLSQFSMDLLEAFYA